MKLQQHIETQTTQDRADEKTAQVWDRLASEIQRDGEQAAESYLRSTEVPHGGE